MRLSYRIFIGLLAGILTLALIAALTVALTVQPTTPASANPLQQAAAATPTPGEAKKATPDKTDQYEAAFTKSLADHLGVDEAKLNAAFAAAVSDTAAQAVKDGQLSQEQANRINQNVQKDGFKQFVPIFFKSLSAPALEPMQMAEGAAFEGAAQALGLTPEQFKQALSTGKSIAEVVQEKKVDLQKVKDAMLAGVKTRLDNGVQKGLWTQTEADEAYKEAPAMIEKLVNDRPGAASSKGDDLTNPKALIIGSLDEVAKLLGLTRAEFDTKWKSDSIANIAKTQNVEVAKVKETLLNSFKRQADEAVKAGKLKQAQADEVYGQATGLVDNFIASVPDGDKSRRVPPGATPGK